VSDVTLLDRILGPDGIRVLFQPIFDRRHDGWHMYGLEALTRGPLGTNAARADVLFEYVRRKREEARVDRACVAAVLDAARALPQVPTLSINVHASTLGRDRDFPAFLSNCAEANGIVPSRLVIEVVEHAPSWDGPAFLKALQAVRDMGMRIALDDIGLGQSNYRMILECRPDVFKIDRYLVKGAATDFHRRATLQSIADLARSFGGLTVAEGVEDRADLEAIQSAGIHLVQGFLLSGPMTAEDLCASDLLWSVPLAVDPTMHIEQPELVLA
jgi:EAL domain-containing protein (putative c-di-GMP-specific phosphodiesterase class I)